MTSLREIRDISANDHTAQTQLGAALDKMTKTSAKIILPPGVGGSLDFSALADRGFRGVRDIELGAGNITSLSGLPSGLAGLVCAENKLLVLEGLPDSLARLNCSGNRLAALDLAPLVRLEALNCADNDLAELGGFAESLVELRCSGNRIAKLDLSSCQRLALLHAERNHRVLVVQHRPASLGDLLMDGDSLAEVDHRADTEASPITPGGAPDDARRNFADSLDEYFRLKAQYESGVKRQRRAAYDRARAKGLSERRAGRLAAEVAPLCLKCRARGGTRFWKKDHRYAAACGAAAPCGLDIKIFAGAFVDFGDVLAACAVEQEAAKQRIIAQKMDAIFGYVAEARAAVEFEAALAHYTATSEAYGDLRAARAEMYENPSRVELTARKEEAVDGHVDRLRAMLERHHGGGGGALRDAMDVYVRDLSPEVRYLRDLKYPVMEMSPGEAEGETALFQRAAPAASLAYLLGEAPQVVRFAR